ncbi:MULTISPECIES: DUF488 domain-containing protein [Streptomyces]|uniref:DUF488 domain-containing protein n=1 Tax=Streptomyces venezuelae TaxID=54571 RepID=A0A5P2BBC0_STRVZ|nr:MULTISPECIES: DUF488 domain-containing protein [Streptomyces]NEA04233.1 DUF488 domain-containing protein [Streptomyces sp. SID10116]MYY86719.1 DUF488 family protein [Streptomyces sp. SID335]MYZ19295.1 DUF488 family protein [Streptomyces sp. SID337]NDZ90077.1 DUF488 domain-containing protein [Streptomyces sp. SID10115]NEB44506.1 DUF488 domain-containing protein [Streptomyces sp. SID339]
MSSDMLMTIGHSNHDLDTLVELLRRHGITAVADVRSVPASQFAPHFNRKSLEPALYEAGIKYVFLGEELGARTDDMSCYAGGRVQYGRLARTAKFREGIERLTKGAVTERIAIMCTEGEPLNCHRTVLVSRVLVEGGATIQHIHGDGRVESHDSAMERLMGKFGLAEPELFRTPAERLDEALSRQEERIAYVRQDSPADTERTADV